MSEEEKKATPKLTESDKIWNEIKDLVISMYALPGQKVSDHVERVKLSTKEVHLKLNSPSVIASLDAALNSVTDNTGNTSQRYRYDIELTEGGFVIVKRADLTNS